jgi:hypothetical protein
MESKMASPLANGQGGLTPRCPRGKNLKLAIYIFLEFLINKDKNRGMFLFTFLPMGAMRGLVLPGPCKLNP